MDKKKQISRKRPIKIEIETDLRRPVIYSSDEASRQSLLKESNVKSDEEIESSRACSSNYFNNDQIKTSFESFVIEDIKEEEHLSSSDSRLSLDRLEQYAKKQKWEPSNWREQFDLIRQMRGGNNAPVDTMGCDALASIDPTLSPQERRYQVLVSLMLSSQTKDEVTAQAMSKLQKIPLTIENFLATSNEELEKMIYPVSFYKRKVIYIKKTSQILKEKYNSDIPQTVEELQKLPGVGPKMAYCN